MSKDRIELDFDTSRIQKSFRISKPAEQLLSFVVESINKRGVELEGIEKEEGKQVFQADVVEKALWDLFKREGFLVEQRGVHIEVPDKYKNP